MSRKNRDRIQRSPNSTNPQEPIRIPGNVNNQNSVTVSQYSEHYQGPWLPPSLLRQYEDIIPGSADRVLTLIESQAAHRMHLERTVIEGDNRRANWGIVCAFLMGACILGIGGWLVYFGHDISGTTIITSTLISGISVFLYTHYSRRKERETKIDVARKNTR